MAQDNGLNKLKAALIFTIVVNLFYGIALFVMPGILSVMAGGTPVEHGWLRWSGGMMLGLAAGAMQAYQNPAHQKSLITTLTAAPLLVGLADAYTMLFESYSIHTWFILMPCVIAFALFGVMLWAKQGAKNILD